MTKIKAFVLALFLCLSIVAGLLVVGCEPSGGGSDDHRDHGAPAGGHEGHGGH